MMPAGIESGLEIYRYAGHIRVLINGQRKEYINLPEEIRRIFKNDMLSDKPAMEKLRLMGFKNRMEMELIFIGCRYGAIDSKPDLDINGPRADAPYCSIRNCPGYGIVCHIPDYLTRQEYQVAVYVGKGKLDKEICSILDIALPTLRTYYARIHEKLRINNRIEIALWAQNLGIV